MRTGYKVFNSDWTCRKYKYEVGKTYTHKGNIALCEEGFHFCKKASDCFNYYGFNSSNKVAEIQYHNNVIHGEDKSVCDKIKIVKEISWQEVLVLVNQGKDNTGLCNTGNRNTGNWNTGDRNTGNWNTGDRNTGNWNTGDRNTGNRNTGNWNTGDRNTGDRNTGDWNSCNYSNGVFCTEEPKIMLFDKLSNLTYRDWISHDARHLLNNIRTVFWCCSSDMTCQEKELHPEHETTGGFLKTVCITDASEKWWEGLSDEKRNIIKNMPNFDSQIFYSMTGLKV